MPQGIDLNSIMEKVANKNQEQPSSLENVVGEKTASATDDSTVEQAEKLATVGRKLAQSKVNEVAQERQKVAEEHGAEALKDMDKAAALDQVGREWAQQKVAEAQEVEQIQSDYNQIKEAHGKEAADSMAKLAYFQEVGQQLADEAVLNS